jgi:very-short-patch-repair endonuclease
MSLENQLLKKIQDNPGQLARDMASEFGIDKKTVNSVLFGKLNGLVWQDRKYRWHPKNQIPNKEKLETAQYSNTPLSKLARYYLACMGQDEGGISVFAKNQYGDLDYTELSEMPSILNSNIFHTPESQRLLGKLRKDRSRLAMYLGYPSTLKFVKSKKSNWSGYFVEPLFLFPVELDSQSEVNPLVDMTCPVLNQSVLRRFTNAEQETLMNELVQLEEELGLTDTSEVPEIDEIAHRLGVVRPEWPWIEPCNPDKIYTEPPLSIMDKEGIYNRAVLIVGERSPFTQGLESELKYLASLPESQYMQTALGHWITGKTPPFSNKEKCALIEVMPINSEQREAIQNSLQKQLTIITGPPGTGKSQVVTDLLVNAAWQGKRVLFASKNNKAVDVVETRVNNLGPRPILLRVGSNQYQTKLAEYLLGLLSATSTKDDQQAFDESWGIHHHLENKFNQFDNDLIKIVKMRNKVDALERSAEDARELLSKESFSYLKSNGLKEIKIATDQFCEALRNATRENHPFIRRWFWNFFKKSHFEQLEKTCKELEPKILPLGLQLPIGQIDDDRLKDLYNFSKVLVTRVKSAQIVRNYTKALNELQILKPVESVTKEQSALVVQMANNAESLWKNWLRLQPSRLSHSDRVLLSRYSSLLKMVIDNGPDARLGRDVYNQYAGLFTKVAHLLPCWAVTSLSARGKIPFEPGFFDLVVFDEASQCDIASALPLLYRAKRAAVIGDPKQLPHISGMQRGQDQLLLEKFDLVTDYANWAYSYNSLFDLSAGMAAGSDIINLRDHHRSHADIIEFSNQFFYEGRLRIATRYERLNRPSNNLPGIRWIHVSGEVNCPSTGGAMNHAEAIVVVKSLRNMVIEQGYSGSVGVVSPFRAQANLIRHLISQDTVLEQQLINADFLVDTVHKFQGDERDVMFFSPVLSIGMSSGALNFLKKNGNLFNVAITRARAMLLVIGDQYISCQSDVDYLRKFAVYVQALDQQQQIHHVQLIEDMGPNYPDVSNPERVSDWEKILYVALHKAGIRSIPQLQIEKYALDLAIIDGERKLDVEVDGERYHRNWTGELCRRDQIRNHRMFELGWDVMRFWVYEIRDDLENCVSRVNAWVNKK